MEVPLPYEPFIDRLEQAVRDRTPEQVRIALGENAPELATLMRVLRKRYEDSAEPPSFFRSRSGINCERCSAVPRASCAVFGRIDG